MGAGISRPSTDASNTMSTTQQTTTTAGSHLDDKLSTQSSSSSSSSLSIRTKEKKKPPENESVYNRAQRLCRKQKRKYDACYTAQLSSKEEDCNDLFEAYRTCFLRVMAKDMEKRGVKVSESSMIGEYKDEIAEDQ